MALRSTKPCHAIPSLTTQRPLDPAVAYKGVRIQPAIFESAFAVANAETL